MLKVGDKRVFTEDWQNMGAYFSKNDVALIKNIENIQHHQSGRLKYGVKYTFLNETTGLTVYNYFDAHSQEEVDKQNEGFLTDLDSVSKQQELDG